MSFKVSVVIPVHNAEKFVAAAVESAAALPEVGEIILVEDKSPDNALAVCKMLASLYPIVKIFQNEGDVSRGAGESRNLGIRMATFEYVSFLDADDLYAVDRFTKTREVVQDYNTDGIFEAVGIFRNSTEKFKLYAPQRRISHDRLFHYLLRGTFGHFHTNGLTVRKSLLEKCGGFNTSLRLHQDSDLWLKLAYHGRLAPGNLSSPVAFVRRHAGNRITHADNVSKLFYWNAVWGYFKNQKIGLFDKLIIKKKIARLKAEMDRRFFPYVFLQEVLAS